MAQPFVVDDGASDAEGLTVCIPVRNEAHNVEACLRAVLANRGVPYVRVVVLDDGSSDDTRVIASMVAAHDERVEVVEGGDLPLPRGWIGKTWLSRATRENGLQSTLRYHFPWPQAWPIRSVPFHFAWSPQGSDQHERALNVR
jgi:glycosyltransferase involved in cell wall biosynthesis